MPPGGSVVKRALNFAERIAVIEQYEKTPNKNHIARAFDCGRGQITNILRHKEQYLADWAKHKDPTRVRRFRSTELAFLGMVVREWIKRCRYFGVIVTDDLIKNIGMRVAQLTNYTEFRSTNRWLERFKGKYKLSGVDLLQPTPNKSDKGNLTEKSLVLEQIIDDLRYHDIKSYEKAATKFPDSEIITDEPKTYGKTYGRKRQRNNQTDNEDSNFVNGEVLNDVRLSVVELPDEDEEDSSSKSNDGLEYKTEHNEDDLYAGIQDECAKEIESYKHALNHLGPLEQFLLMQEDIRSIGLVNQLENIFREKMLNSSS